MICPPPTTFANLQTYQIRMADKEIDIFGAEKYFNGAMDEEHGKVSKLDGEKNQVMEVDKCDMGNIKLNFTPGYRRSGSEASWGSQKALLPELPRDRTPSRKNMMNGKNFFSAFSWKCSCYNSKSVDTRHTVGENKNSRNNKKKADRKKAHMETPPIKDYQVASSPGFKRKEEFVSMVSSSVVTDLAAGKEWAEKLEGNQCNRLEGFGSPILCKGDKAMSLDKRLTSFAWDINANAEDAPAISAREIQDDEESDSSSDLFEIKNLSENAHPFFRDPVPDDKLTCVTTTCYEPSEATTEWSAITASTVNESTMSNNQDKKTETEITHTKATTKSTSEIGKQAKRSESPQFCKSQRALKVPGDASSVPEKSDSNRQRHHITGTLTTMSESQTTSVVRNFASKSLQQASRACSVSQWQSAQASHSLDMH